MLTSGRISETSVLFHLWDSAVPGMFKIDGPEMQGLDVVCPHCCRTRQTRREDVKLGSQSRAR